MGKQVEVLNSAGQSQGSVELPDGLFAVEVSEYALYRAVVTYESNQRQGTAAVRTRSEVSRSGKKHHRQKGTGWARRGSLRSPVVRGGGVAFGPQPRGYRGKMTKALKRLALGSALTLKAREGAVRVVEELELAEPSTREFAKAMGGWGVGDGRLLYVTAAPAAAVVKSCRNLPNVAMAPVTTLGTYDVMAADTVVFTRAAFAALSQRAAGDAAAAQAEGPAGAAQSGSTDE